MVFGCSLKMHPWVQLLRGMKGVLHRPLSRADSNPVDSSTPRLHCSKGKLDLHVVVEMVVPFHLAPHHFALNWECKCVHRNTRCQLPAN